MAVITKALSDAIRLVVNITKDGKTTTLTRTYNNVKSTAEASSVYNTGKTLADLQKHPLNRIARVTVTELEETV